MKKIMSIPNYSEGKDRDVIEKILDAFRGKKGVKLLDFQPDEDHNRTVVEVVGEPEALKASILESVKIASELIDMRKHKGAHPRMGAVDVIPFVPVQNATVEDCKALAEEVGEAIGKLNVPVYMYEDNARCEERVNLANIRKGQYEGFYEKIKEAEWKPDFGPQVMNEKFGCVAVGARFHLVAFNVNLNTSDVEIAKAIARKVRYSGGGLRHVKGIGLKLEEKNLAQVSMNLVNYEEGPIYQALENVKMEAKRYGVSIAGTELIGLVPVDALVDTFKYYTGAHEFETSQIIEMNLLEAE